MANYPALDAAIAQFEGFGKAGAIPTVQHNPGDIIWGSFAVAHGSTGPGAGNGIAVFPDDATGAAAQDALVTSYANQGATISDLINAWAPGSAPGNTPASTANYLTSVTAQLGVPASTLVSQTAGVAPSTTGAAPSALEKALGTFLGNQAASGALAAPVQTAATGSLLWGLPISRIAAFILGLICIAGGIFLFKPAAGGVTIGGRLANRVIP